MNKSFKKIAIILAMFTLLSTTTYAATVPASTPTKIITIQGQAVEVNTEDWDTAIFVKRLFRFCLHREPGVQEFNNWIEAMIYGKYTGRSIVRSFFNCAEFQGQNVTDNEFLERLYNTCFGRRANPEEISYWASQLISNLTRSQVIEVMLYYYEFSDLCYNYGIPIGK